MTRPSRWTRWSALLLGSSVTSVMLGAQGVGRVQGTVFDSLAMQPLAQSAVTLISVRDSAVRLRATGDAQGRFAFDSVPLGPWVAIASHPRLDSLAVRELVSPVDVAGTGLHRVKLAVPTSRTLVRRVCTADDALRAVALPPDEAGYLRGRVREARSQRAVRAGVVRAEWIEDVLQDGRPTRELASVTTTVDSTGIYQLCDIPRQVPMRLVVAAVLDTAGPFELTLAPDGVQYRDLYVGRGIATTVVPPGASTAERDSLAAVEVRRGTSRILGRVLDANGRPIANARVGHAASLTEARTDSSGGFVLSDLAPGTLSLDVRALGYASRQEVVDVLLEDARPTIVMTRAEKLDTLRIRAGRSGRDARFAEFEARKRTGLGKYLGPEELARLNPIRVTDAFDVVPGIIRQFKGGQWIFTMRGTTGRCAPTIMVDGVIMRGTGNLDSFLPVSDVLAIEVYSTPAKAPSQFTRTNRDCGVIVIWTGAMMAGRSR